MKLFWKDTDWGEKSSQSQMLVDSTKVKTGKKQQDSPVHMAVTAQHGPQESGRLTIVRNLVYQYVGPAFTLKQRLKALKVQRVFHDVGEDHS